MLESERVLRLCSGVRPRGPLHLGHYFGVLRQWLSLQNKYECFFLIADVQALTTRPEKPEVLASSVRDVALDWLATGLDPAKASYVVQSRIPELAELTLYLQMLVRTGELRGNATMREEARALGQHHLYESVNDIQFALLGYPVAQVADILIFTTAPPGKGDCLVVPVGEDQLPHVELARTVAHRFNRLYGRVFLEPEAWIEQTPALPGTDGGYRMGKSRRSAILLTDSEAECAAKIRAMCTDPLRLAHGDPGHPHECPCFAFLTAFNRDPDDLRRRAAGCRSSETECEECKERLVDETRRLLGPLQERRAAFARDPVFVEDVLAEGARRARKVAGNTLERVKEAMCIARPPGKT